jgi:hypothetical protein
MWISRKEFNELQGSSMLSTTRQGMNENEARG